MGHTHYNLLYHGVWSTKGRRLWLYEDMRPKLFGYLTRVISNLDATLLRVNAVDDHVHLLVAAKPTHALSDLVRNIKSNSSRLVHENFSDLRDISWQSGFGFFTVSASNADAVARYIERQEIHHRTMSFAEEYRLLLERHGVPYDAEHYLD